MEIMEESFKLQVLMRLHLWSLLKVLAISLIIELSKKLSFKTKQESLRNMTFWTVFLLHLNQNEWVSFWDIERMDWSYSIWKVLKWFLKKRFDQLKEIISCWKNAKLYHLRVFEHWLLLKRYWVRMSIMLGMKAIKEQRWIMKEENN